MRLYIDTTGELVIDDGLEAHYYPAFSPLKRIKVGTTKISICALFNLTDSPYVKECTRVNGTLATELTDSLDVAYADQDAAWAAIDDYFDDVV